MRIILQRVSSASVTVEKAACHKIGHGLVALVGFGHEDGQAQADYLASKLVELRIFEDEDGAMNRSLLDVGGSCLIIPNFTLYANCKKGRRPSFVASMAPDPASSLFDYFTALVKEKGIPVECGVFGTHMDVELVNDGPVTILLDTDEIMPRRQ